MGLCLFPADDNVDSPDVSWSYSGFAAFRRRLAATEGFDLAEMWGFGGERPWGDVSTTLVPLLDHPDDFGELSSAECAAILPRLEAIIGQWLSEAGTPTLRRHIEDARQLAVVLRLCAEKDVAALFG
ncbi:hypothetical protein ACWEN3_22855 [Streptomyces sp. NPDC004561]